MKGHRKSKLTRKLMTDTTIERTAESGRRHFLALALMVAWLLTCISVFWWFQFRHISTIDDYWVTFSGDLFTNTEINPSHGKALVVHFVDPECPCSRFSFSHIEKMEARFEDDVEFINFSSIPADDKRKETLSTLSIPAGPSVAIWAEDGKLAYFGPYSGGSVCGQGTDFVSTTLSSLDAGFNPRWINQEAVGCYCQWPAIST